MRDIFYFHGLNSSPATDKVDRLRKLFPNDNVYGMAIDSDPRIAYRELTDQINWALATNLHSNGEIVFIGTSMGAYWAGIMAQEYYLPTAILINPVMNPTVQLCDQFEFCIPLDVRGKQKYAFSIKDEVIDQTETKLLLTELGVPYSSYDEPHRFNGPAFEEVCLELVP